MWRKIPSVRLLFWLYFFLFLLRVPLLLALRLAEGHSAASTLPWLVGPIAAATGMLLYRSGHSSTSTRRSWRWVVAFIVADLALKLAIDLSRSSDHFPVGLAILAVAVALTVAAPSVWMNLRYALGYSGHTFRKSASTIARAAVPQTRSEAPEPLATPAAGADLAIVAPTSSTPAIEPTPRLAINWALAVAITALIVSTANVFLTYQNYKLARVQPRLGVHIYKVEGNEELWYRDTFLEASTATIRGNTIEVPLPLKVINHSDYDASDLTVWLRAADDEAKLFTANRHYSVENYANLQWIVANTDRLSPHSAIKYYGIYARLPKGKEAVSVEWKIYAARTTPVRGTVSFALRH